jgi:OOP family OmpA-OmpF porin
MHIQIIQPASGNFIGSRSLPQFLLYITLVGVCMVLAFSTAISQESADKLDSQLPDTSATGDPLAQAAEARDLAVNANAPAIAEKQWQSAEKSWGRAQSARNKGKEETAQELAIQAQQLFLEAELLAIQNMLLLDARAAISQAQKNKAERYAPRTLAHARKLIAEAEQALAAYRYAIELPTALADQATATAIHAEQITTVARKKPATEDLILQWEDYLSRLQTAAAVTTSADTEPKVSVNQLEEEIIRLRDSEQQLRRDLADSRAFGAALEEEIRELDMRLGGASTERQQLVLRLEEQARAREQFAQAEALFSPEEALVFRQSNKIVVRVIGLHFASGSPNLNTDNEALLRKLGNVIALYPRSLLLIEGHTDSSGSDRINKRLSDQRAQAVANHIIARLQIPAHRLTALGYGAARPIANNGTKEGRAKNRRIDLLITPENGTAF